VRVTARLVALVSAKGGVGRTTLAAHLAFTVAQAGRRVAAADLDPQNALVTHFPPDARDAAGLADGRASRTVRRGGRERSGPVCVPYFTRGEPPRRGEDVAGDPGALTKRLEALVPNECELVFCDTPAFPSPWRARALEVADLVLVVHAADPACCATLPALTRAAREARGPAAAVGATAHVVNQFDARSPLARDVLQTLRGTLGEALCPVLVRHDPAVPEALAARRPLHLHAPDSQTVADLTELAEWIDRALPAPRTRSVDTIQPLVAEVAS
jgi:chromosome partitioning protein